jgi:hypothetical protein
MGCAEILTPKFTAKSLNRQAKKANKDEIAEKNKLKLVRLSPRVGDKS